MCGCRVWGSSKEGGSDRIHTERGRLEGPVPGNEGATPSRGDVLASRLGTELGSGCAAQDEGAGLATSRRETLTV